MSAVVESNGRWQSNIKSLKEGIHHVYDTKEFHDVVITVGTEHFKAHKLVLAARCSEFARILLDPNAVDDVIVHDESVTKTGFEIFLRFIYKDSLDTEDKQSILEALMCANYYKQRALKEKCEEIIDTWFITADEVCTLLNASFNIPKLKENCLDFIKHNANDVIASSDFLKLNVNALSIILKDGALTDVPVVERIKRIMDWGAARHGTPVDYAIVRKDFLNNQPSILGMLGLQALNLEEFSNVAITYKGIVTPEEVSNFMEYIITNNRAVLPLWAQ